VGDIDTLIGNGVADGAYARGCYEKSKSVGSRRSNASNANAVDLIVAGSGRDDDYFVIGRGKGRGEIMEMALDPADARMIPVANEGNLQIAIDTGSRPLSAI
jgi:hypothetical protein